MPKKEFCRLLGLQYLLGNKWTFPLLFEIKNRCTNFNELRKRTQGKINPTLLSQTLKQLQDLGIIEVNEEDKRCYQATEVGNELLTILTQLRSWGEKRGYCPGKACIKQSCMTCGHFI
tara:strand:- start:288 stop:641 length:354 start_codon:yes stop_codon:yes gene_type:complete